MSEKTSGTTYDRKQRSKNIFICLAKILLFLIVGFVLGYVVYTFIGA